MLPGCARVEPCQVLAGHPIGALLSYTQAAVCSRLLVCFELTHDSLAALPAAVGPCKEALSSSQVLGVESHPIQWLYIPQSWALAVAACSWALTNTTLQ